MKRLTWMTLVFSLCLALCLPVCMAQADTGYPVNPYQQKVREIDRIASQIGRRGVPIANIDITTEHEPAIGETGSWTVSVQWDNLSQGVTVVQKDISICSIDPSGEYTTEYLFLNPTEDLTSCVFAAPGTYQLVALYYFSDGSCYAGVKEFTIAPTADAPALDDKIASIMAECMADTQWGKMLKLHDWLTKNAYYDYSYSFYGAQDVLYRGTGVCDSYSKAFWFLLNKAGIENHRVISDTHAWNAVKLDGEWYHVDVTWDDPGRAETLISGKESHDYFCINDELIYGMLDQDDSECNPIHYTGNNFYGSCTSLDMSYPIHEGTWTEGAQYYESGSTKSYMDQILAAYAGSTAVPFTLAGNQAYPGSGGSYYSFNDTNEFIKLRRYYYAQGLTKFGLETTAGQQLNITADYDYDADPPVFTISALEAADPPPEALTWTDISSLINGEEDEVAITLTGDVTAEQSDTVITIPTGKTVTLDLNGFTLNRGRTDNTATLNGYTFHVAEGAALIINDSEGGGQLTGSFDVYGHGCVWNEGTFTLNGGAITGNRSCAVENDGTFTLAGGSLENSVRGKGIMNHGTAVISSGIISGNSAGGIHNYSDGTVTINGGSLRGNHGDGVDNYGALTMNGGSITETEGAEGSPESYSAVVCYNGSSFTMNGGSITDNVTYTAGAVWVYEEASFTMTGGEISGNQSEQGSGGVANQGVMTMTGGSIINNTAGENAGGLVNYSQLTLGGDPVITGNTVDGAASNLVLYNNYLIYISSGGLDGDARIGVTARPSSLALPYTFTSGLGETASDTPVMSTIFSSDNSAYVAATLNGEAVLTVDWNGMSWTSLQVRLNAQETEMTIPLDRNVTANPGDGMLVIPTGKRVTLDLNGYTLDRNMRAMQYPNGYAIKVEQGAVLTIRDSSAAAAGTITGEYSDSSGTACILNEGTLILNSGSISRNYNSAVLNRGTFVMYGGKITGNGHTTAESGSSRVEIAVEMKDGGQFTMYGGSITANIGMPIWVYNGSFTMNGGSITNNPRGGITVFTDGTMTMNYGTISGNGYGNTGTGAIRNQGGKVTINGGTITGNTGMYTLETSNESGVFTITGGSVKNNSCAGIALWGGKLAISGNFEFANNVHSTQSFYSCDVYLARNQTITIADELAQGVSLIVNPLESPSPGTPTPITSGFFDEEGNARAYASSFQLHSRGQNSWCRMMQNGELTFAYNYGLEADAPDFVLPGDIRTIEQEAFAGSGASIVSISASTAQVAIGSKAFTKCRNLSRIYIPVNVTSIADDAFDPHIALIIFGTKNSPAQTYAETHGYTFIQKK